MNIDNLIKELQQIDIEKLTDDELEELGKNIPTLAEKTANEIVKRYVMNGGKIF
nr:MAG TPA: Proteasome-associated ATPase, Prokaryotic ubiquitin-like protein coil alpha helix, ATP-binding.8A [Caudoviricetes sp.]